MTTPAVGHGTRALSGPIASGQRGRFSVPTRFLPLSQFFLQKGQGPDDGKVLYGRQERPKKKTGKDTKKQLSAPDGPTGRQEGALSDVLSLMEKKSKPKKAVYLAAFVDKPSDLTRWWEREVGPLHGKTFAGHVTLAFKPDEGKVRGAGVGSPVKLRVVGYAQDEKAQAVVVEGVKRLDPGVTHITVATDGTSPAYSKELLSRGYTKVRGPVLTGRIGFFNAKEAQFDFANTIYEAEVQSDFTPLDESAAHAKSIALMKWLSQAAKDLRVDRHVYVVGGAVRNFVIDQPIKDVDVVIDAVALGGKRDSEWFAKQLQRRMKAKANLTTNQYGVAILTIKGDWDIDGNNLKGEVIEIANARAESYGGTGGKGYKPSDIRPAPIEKDIKRREFTFNTLMWRLADLARGPDKAEIIDLTGCGLADLKAGAMRCPMDPDKTFSDDPTRMLRAIKFMIKYGFRITKDTEASIRRNADKIRNAPSSAIAKLLIDPILKEPKTAPKALREMKRLGLLDIVAKMIRTDPQFASTMTNWANDQRVAMLFTLMDMGLPLKTKLGAFSSDQQKRIREVTATMPDTKAREFLAALKQPGKAWKDKLFFVTLAAEMGAEKGRAMGDLARRVNKVAQDVMLADPELAGSPDKLKVAIRQGLSTQEGITTTANVPTVPVPIGAGDGRKFLDRPGDKKKKRKKDLPARIGLLLRRLF